MPSLRQTLSLQQGTLAKPGPSLAVQPPHALTLGPLNFWALHVSPEVEAGSPGWSQAHRGQPGGAHSSLPSTEMLLQQAWKPQRTCPPQGHHPRPW